MSAEIMKRGPRAVPPPRREWWDNEEDVQLIKETVAPDLNDPEFRAFVYVARERRLNPLLRQIYAVLRVLKNGKRRVTHQTSIDGFRATAARTREHAGTDDAVFSGAKLSAEWAATVTVYRLVGGQRCAFTATARWLEYCPDLSGPDGFMWKKMPMGQLSKCAEALALRKGFPEDLGGIYIHEEMDQAGGNANVIEVPAADVTLVDEPKTLPAPAPASEMEESLRAQKKAPEKAAVRAKKAEPAPHPMTDTTSVDNFVNGPKITRAQQLKLFQDAKEVGIEHEALKVILKQRLGLNSTSDIPQSHFESFLHFVKAQQKPEQKPQEAVV
jgi:phage recombination protein Bet